MNEIRSAADARRPARAPRSPTSTSTLRALLVCALVVCASQHVAPQSPPTPERSAPQPPRLSQQNALAAAPLVRRTTRRELRRTGYGSALSLLGAPAGDIRIEAWSRGETEITAEIELRADTEEDLARLAAVNTFALDGDATRLNLVTVGTHDRKHLRRVARDFPKRLLAAAWRIDYIVRVPAVSDLEIYAGRGAVSVSGVEGAIRVNLTEGDLTLAPAGGDVSATVARGSINFASAARSWRGRGVDLRLGSGALVAELPADFSADFNAQILQTGRLENAFGAPAPFEVAAPPAAAVRPLSGRFGAGGAAFTFTVGSGDIRLRQAAPLSNQ